MSAAAPEPKQHEAPTLRVECQAERGPTGVPQVVLRAGVGVQMQAGFALPPVAARAVAQRILEQCDAAEKMLVVPGGGA